MGYSTFATAPKALVTSEQIGRGQIKIEHLDPALFTELKNVALHSHTGSRSRKISYQNLTGYIPPTGFLMFSSDGTKKYTVTIDSGTGAFVLTEV